MSRAPPLAGGGRRARLAAVPPAPPRKPPLSSPFTGRDFNGTTLLAELHSLREAQVRQPQLNDCAAAIRQLAHLRVSDAGVKLRQLASGRFASQPVLGALLVRWSSKLRTDSDVEALAGHIDRLVIASALIGAMRRGAERLLAGGGPQ